MINGNTYDKDIRKWIEKAKATRNMALTNFAYGIEKDWEAVQAAIDLPFSNGLLEGTVNKESWLSVVYFLPYCTSAFLAL